MAPSSTASTTKANSSDTKLPVSGSELAKVLAEFAKESRSRVHFFQQTLELLACHFEATYGQITIESKSDTTRLKWDQNNRGGDQWASICEGLALDVRYRRNAVAKWIEEDNTEQSRVILATGIESEGEGMIGAIALVLSQREKVVAQTELRELQAYLALASKMLVGSQETKSQPGNQTSIKDATIQKAASYETFPEFAYSFANSLTTKLGCEQVSLGWVHGHRIKLECVSGVDVLTQGKPGIVLIEQAMSEALDAGEIVTSRTVQQDGRPEYKLQKEWRQEIDSELTASIPLKHGDKVLAIVSLRDSRKNGLTDEQLKKVEKIATPLLPAMVLLRKADRSVLSHMSDRVHDVYRSSTHVRHLAHCAGAIVFVLLVAWFILGSQTYQVVATCRLEPSESFELSAPFGGTLSECLVRPGDIVKEGDPLLRFDTEELQAMEQSIQSRLQVAELQVRQAIADSDVALAAQARAKVTSLKNELSVAQFKLDQATLYAPCDGVVLKHQVEQRVGSVFALGEPLLAVGSSEHWHARLSVPERTVKHLRPGQTGKIVSTADPRTQMKCQIDRIEIAAQPQSGNNFIHVVTSIDGSSPEWARSGMEGVARIDAGKKPVWWIWTHGAIDSWRIKTWSM